MTNIEDKLREKNPKLTHRSDFVESVMSALPDSLGRVSTAKKVLAFLKLPASSAVAGIATFALLAVFVLPSVVNSGVNRSPEVARDSQENLANDKLAIDNFPSEQEKLAPIPIEHEAKSIESEVDQIEKDIDSMEVELNDASLGLN